MIIDEKIDTTATVGDMAYRHIRNDIIFGRLEPGARLKLEPLRRRYEVSITTLREIFNRLNADGFVVAEGQKGFQVAPVSNTDLREIAELRVLLEGHALRRAFANGDLEWETNVVAAHHRLHVLETRMLSGYNSVREDWKQADWQFHRSLIAGAGSQALLGVHASVFDKYLRYQMISLTFRGKVASEEHRLLKEAALKRDADQAIAALERHIAGGVEHSIGRETSPKVVAAE